MYSVLKITTKNDSDAVRLKLEGKLAGAWVAELEKTWRSLGASLDGKKLALDLREVTFIDAAGRELLAKIYAATGASFQTDSLMIDFLVHRAMQEEKDQDGKEKRQ